jgi:hypothetical protein
MLGTFCVKGRLLLVMQVRLVDESPGNAEQLWMSIEAPAERLTLRELIRLRVESEVARYNTGLPQRYHGLVQPGEVERILQGDRPGGQRKLDSADQLVRACKSFEKNGFFVSVDGRPVGSLDEVIQIGPKTDIRFLKLVPLTGG